MNQRMGGATCQSSICFRWNGCIRRDSLKSVRLWIFLNMLDSSERLSMLFQAWLREWNKILSSRKNFFISYMQPRP